MAVETWRNPSGEQHWTEPRLPTLGERNWPLDIRSVSNFSSNQEVDFRRNVARTTTFEQERGQIGQAQFVVVPRRLRACV